MKRAGLLVAAVALLACGPLKDPFALLTPGACAVDADCAIASCPNACNRGQPYCSYPEVFRRADIVAACPCFESVRDAASCREPTGEACGPQPGCAGPFDVDQVRAVCVSGTCAARFTDGGVPGAQP